MQPQHREVHVENDEYERQQRLAKQTKRVVVLINDHILAFCAFQKRDHVLKLFQQNAYALPSFSMFSKFLHFVAHASLVPRLVCAPPTHEPGNEVMHMLVSSPNPSPEKRKERLVF